MGLGEPPSPSKCRCKKGLKFEPCTERRYEQEKIHQFLMEADGGTGGAQTGTYHLATGVNGSVQMIKDSEYEGGGSVLTAQHYSAQ